jgi:ABC-type cobalamin transport system ATPase subunit
MGGIFPWGLPPITDRYGAMKPGTSWTVPAKYASLVGANNSGKSTLLQYAFVAAMNDVNVGSRRVCYIPADRFAVFPTTQVGGRTLENWNDDMVANVRSGPMAYGQSFAGPQRSELYALLLQSDDYLAQLQRLDTYLPRLGFESMRLRGAQTAHFGEIQAVQQGSGLRNVLPILAALTDPELRLILVDEPELSLEPLFQRRLKALLLEAASDQRAIVVATQSHLMVERSDLASVLRVERKGDDVAVTPVATAGELVDVVFRLLGNSTEDLFFPANFLIVEGASDAEICNAVLAINGSAPGHIKVLSAGGVDSIRKTIAAVERALVPLVMNDSPYAKTAVALIDHVEGGRVSELRRVLGDRLYMLDEPSLEEYLPEDFYVRAGMDKVTMLSEIQAVSGQRRSESKRQVATAISGILSAADLDRIPLIQKAVTHAIAGAT